MHGTGEDVDFMVTRARRLSKAASAPSSEVSYVLSFLRRFAHEPRAAAALAALEAHAGDLDAELASDPTTD
jgi:hypothetical protein